MKDNPRATEEGIKRSGIGYKPVTFNEGQTLANKIKALHYFETSAYSGEGIQETMSAVLTNLVGEPKSKVVKFCCCCVSD